MKKILKVFGLIVLVLGLTVFILFFPFFLGKFTPFKNGDGFLTENYNYNKTIHVEGGKRSEAIVLINQYGETFFLISSIPSYYSSPEFKYRIYKDLQNDIDYLLVESHTTGSASLNDYSIYLLDKTNPVHLYSNGSLMDGLSCFDPDFDGKDTFTYYTSHHCDFSDTVLGRIINKYSSYTLKLSDLEREKLERIE